MGIATDRSSKSKKRAAVRQIRRSTYMGYS